jgi:hypothetical protein
MKVITVINNKSTPGFHLLKLSCAINQLELVALLTSQKDFYTNRIKDEVLIDYLDDQVKDDEIIFFTDGYDAVFMCSETELLRKYYQTGKALVFSAESACWPDETMAHLFPETNTPYRFINSGGFMGKAGTIKHFLKDEFRFDSDFERSNQYVWAKRFLKNPGLIGLDADCEIFQTFSPEIGDCYFPLDEKDNRIKYYNCMKEWFLLNFTIEKGRLFNKITGTGPCHAHFNGSSKSIMDFEISDMLFSTLPGYSPAQYIEPGINAMAKANHTLHNQV